MNSKESNSLDPEEPSFHAEHWDDVTPVHDHNGDQGGREASSDIKIGTQSTQQSEERSQRKVPCQYDDVELFQGWSQSGS